MHIARGIGIRYVNAQESRPRTRGEKEEDEEEGLELIDIEGLHGLDLEFGYGDE